MVLRALGNEPVRHCDDAPLDLDSFGGEGVGRALVRAANEAQGVESRDKRQIEQGPQPHADQARHEEVGVDQVEASRLAHEAAHRVGERRHVRQHRLLGDELGRPGVDVDDAHARLQRDDRRQRPIVAAGEDVDDVAALAEPSCNLVDVDVLPAGVDPA